MSGIKGLFAFDFTDSPAASEIKGLFAFNCFTHSPAVVQVMIVTLPSILQTTHFPLFTTNYLLLLSSITIFYLLPTIYSHYLLYPPFLSPYLCLNENRPPINPGTRS